MIEAANNGALRSALQLAEFGIILQLKQVLIDLVVGELLRQGEALLGAGVAPCTLEVGIALNELLELCHNRRFRRRRGRSGRSERCRRRLLGLCYRRRLLGLCYRRRLLLLRPLNLRRRRLDLHANRSDALLDLGGFGRLLNEGRCWLIGLLDNSLVLRRLRKDVSAGRGHIGDELIVLLGKRIEQLLLFGHQSDLVSFCMSDLSLTAKGSVSPSS